MLFRQLFDKTSSTYTYLLVSRIGGDALRIDPVLTPRIDVINERKLAHNKPLILMIKFGGAEGNRTPDLVIANDALSQLSYGP